MLVASTLDVPHSGFLSPGSSSGAFFVFGDPPFHPNRAPVCGVDQLVTTRPSHCVVASPGPSFCLAAGRGADP